MKTIASAIRIAIVGVLFYLCLSLYGTYQQQQIAYGTQHPTLPIKAQPALCDWRVWFEYGSQPAYVVALNRFAELSGISWVEVENDWDATVIVGRIEGQNMTVLGAAFRSYDLEWRTRININEWGLPIAQDRARVMLHEVLHIFGLYHSPQNDSLMHEMYGVEKYLTETDLENIRLLGSSCAGQ